MAQAYDFALDKIGLDVSSYSIWLDYVNFLKSVEAVGSFAESQKITAIRKVYQKGVMNPMINVEQFWKDYCAFENQINPLIAKRMIDDRSREFLSVRRIAKEFENVTRQLDKNVPSIPPQGSSDEQRQVSFWKKYIEWEKTNPLKYEDQSLVARRVMFAYEQCLLCLSFHADIWYEAANYLYQMSVSLADKGNVALSKQYADEVANLYERAIGSFMKRNLLIHFTYADFEEGRLNYTKVSEIYENLVKINDIDPTLCYIQYMRYLRRAEGIRSARSVFKKAREDARSTYHVFIAAAFMEYFCTKDKTIGLKIFQLGLKKYGHISEFLLSYIDYMTHINDDNATREVFETILRAEQLPRERAVDIWFEYLKFECNVGTLKQILSVEEGRKQLFNELNQFDSKETALLVDRFKFLNLLPCTPNELKLITYKDLNFLAQLVQSATLTSSTSTNIATAIVSTSSAGNTQTSEDLLNTSSSSDTTTMRSKFPQPDVGLMIGFKPLRSQNSTNGTQNMFNVSGSYYPIPTVVLEFIKRLPPPYGFEGPFVMIDEFMQHFMQLNLPEDFNTFNESYKNALKQEKTHVKAEYTNGNEHYTAAASQHHHPQMTSSVSSHSIKRLAAEDSDEEDYKGSDMPSASSSLSSSGGGGRTTTDIFKQRQQKKLIKQA